MLFININPQLIIICVGIKGEGTCSTTDHEYQHQSFYRLQRNFLRVPREPTLDYGMHNML